MLAHHWLGASDEDKAVAYLIRAGDLARQEYALDEADRLTTGSCCPCSSVAASDRRWPSASFKLALALHMSLRFAEANVRTSGRSPSGRRPTAPAESPPEVLRVSSSFLPDDPDPRSAIAWPNIQLCMNLFDRLVEQWPERTIVPNLAESWEIADDGLRYVFHLRDGLTWSDGVSAHCP